MALKIGRESWRLSVAQVQVQDINGEQLGASGFLLDPFGDHLKTTMLEIHDYMFATNPDLPLRELGTQDYEADVVLLAERAAELTSGLGSTMSNRVRGLGTAAASAGACTSAETMAESRVLAPPVPGEAVRPRICGSLAFPRSFAMTAFSRICAVQMTRSISASTSGKKSFSSESPLTCISLCRPPRPTMLTRTTTLAPGTLSRCLLAT
ncbi:hypothetical protein CRUP_021122 [Coryphaenoides rupestris]|nr:hypothetical protein CRUP_021122 [Coryphaenoides rupestris]